VSDRVACATGDSESIAVTVKFEVPADVGVPVIVPAADSVSPAGSTPDVTDHVTGGVPLIAFSEAEYLAPTVAVDNVCGGIASGP
jgi:hypothetical protein